MFCPHCFEAGGLFSLQGPYLDFWHKLKIILLLSFGCCLDQDEVPYLHVILWEEVSRTHHVTRPSGTV